MLVTRKSKSDLKEKHAVIEKYIAALVDRAQELVYGYELLEIKEFTARWIYDEVERSCNSQAFSLHNMYLSEPDSGKAKLIIECIEKTNELKNDTQKRIVDLIYEGTKNILEGEGNSSDKSYEKLEEERISKKRSYDNSGLLGAGSFFDGSLAQKRQERENKFVKDYFNGLAKGSF